MKKQVEHMLRAMFGRTANGFLVTNSETLDGIKREIDEAEERTASLGYRPTEVYSIIRLDYTVWFDDDGNFLKRRTLESVIEVYTPKCCRKE